MLKVALLNPGVLLESLNFVQIPFLSRHRFAVGRHFQRVIVEYPAPPFFVLGVEKRSIVPERQHKRFCNDFFDPILDLPNDYCVCDLAGTDDGLDCHLDFRHLLEREPDAVARRRFYLKQGMALQLSKNNSED
jgi:hypothetical protein